MLEAAVGGAYLCLEILNLFRFSSQLIRLENRVVPLSPLSWYLMQRAYQYLIYIIYVCQYNRTRQRVQTFFDGTRDAFPGVCHIPMEPAFCNETRQVILEAAAELGLKMHSSGTAVTIEGPRFSSKAESNMFRSWNAQLVNMTLVPEVSQYCFMSLLHTILTF